MTEQIVRAQDQYTEEAKRYVSEASSAALERVVRRYWVLRDIVEKVAGECAECGGSGRMFVQEWGQGVSASRTQDCTQCADLREAL